MKTPSMSQALSCDSNSSNSLNSSNCEACQTCFWYCSMLAIRILKASLLWPNLYPPATYGGTCLWAGFFSAIRWPWWKTMKRQWHGMCCFLSQPENWKPNSPQPSNPGGLDIVRCSWFNVVNHKHPKHPKTQRNKTPPRWVWTFGAFASPHLLKQKTHLCIISHWMGDNISKDLENKYNWV